MEALVREFHARGWIATYHIPSQDRWVCDAEILAVDDEGVTLSYWTEREDGVLEHWTVYTRYELLGSCDRRISDSEWLLEVEAKD
jgi:hypothetical protein